MSDVLFELAVVGILIGTLYGLLGVSLTLMFRSTGILSFAHAGFALIGAYTYSDFSCPTAAGTTQCGPPRFASPWIGAVVSIGIVTLGALAVERFVIRPLQGADAVRKSLATAAVLGLCSGLMLQVYGPQPRYVPESEQLFPSGDLTVLGVTVDNQRLGIFVVSATLLVAISVLLRRSWFGLGVRAAGQRPDVAPLFGVKPATISRFNWALGGALSGLAGVLIAPVSVVNVGTFSFFLVKALGAVLLGGLVSLPLTFLGGLGLGAAESITPHFFTQTGAASLGVAAVILARLYMLRDRLGRLGGERLVGGAHSSEPGRIALRVASVASGMGLLARRLPAPARLLAVVLVLVVPLRDNYYGSLGLSVAFYTLLTLSLVLPAGDAGQPSLVQIGFAGLGAFMMATLESKGISFVWAIPVAVGAAAVVGLAVGAVALRSRGVAFAIVSLALAAVISDFVLADDFFDSRLDDPRAFGVSLLESRYAFALSLVLVIVAMAVVASFRRSGLGRAFRTMQSGPRILAHAGVNTRRLELAVFVASAGIAGTSGVVYALLVGGFTTFQFIPLLGVIALLAAVVGGLRSLWGPVIAGVIFGYGPTLVSNLSTTSANAYPQIASSGLALVLIVGAPAGLASLSSWGDATLARARAADGPATVFRRAPVLREHAPELGLAAVNGNARPLAGSVPVTPRLRRLTPSGHLVAATNGHARALGGMSGRPIAPPRGVGKETDQ